MPRTIYMYMYTIRLKALGTFGNLLKIVVSIKTPLEVVRCATRFFFLSLLSCNCDDQLSPNGHRNCYFMLFKFVDTPRENTGL